MGTIRKIVVYRERVLVEGGKPVAGSHVIAAAAAVMQNPWAGLGYVEDLRPEIRRIAPTIGDVLVPELMQVIGGAERVEAFGKAAIVGINGEIEHASALIHTLYFGNKLRDEVKGTAYLSFTNERGSPNCAIDIPLKHKTKEGARSHYLTASFSNPDAPGPDEIIVALAVATSGRPHQRIGDRYEDIEEMKQSAKGAQK